jgi:hypothetical protein
VDDEPVDGFTVEHRPGSVDLTLDNRYGEGEVFTFGALDACRIGHALLTHGLDALGEADLLEPEG